MKLLARRIFVMGPIGCQRHEVAKSVAESFQWKYISVGDLLRKEESAKSEDGKRIHDCFQSFRLGKNRFF
jgi:adenylate kinase family enzyme